MSQAGAVILGLSLVITGICLVGDALKYWDLPSDIWGAVIVVLGAAGRFVSQQKNGDDDPPPPSAPSKPSKPSKPNGSATAVALVLMLVAGGCGANLGPASAWAKCAGGAALACIDAAQGEPAEAAINYSGCVAGQAIKCAAPLVAAQNPPSAQRAQHVDEACAKKAAAACYKLAQQEAPPCAAYQSPQCIEREIATCLDLATKAP
jgi:hypothetical protein